MIAIGKDLGFAEEIRSLWPLALRLDTFVLPKILAREIRAPTMRSAQAREGLLY